MNIVPFGTIAFADTVQYYYDPDGRLVGVVDPVNGSAQYNYDATGNILSITASPATSVSIVGFNPPTAISGTVITIGGTGFDTSADTSVNFNGTAATPSAVTATAITVTVPAGATTGPVTVTAPAGTGASTASFLVVPTPAVPQIASFTPTTVVPGATITITGSNFDPVNGRVEVNGEGMAVVSATTTSIVVTVPTVSSGRLVVKTPVGTATATDDVIVAPPGFATSAIASAQRVTSPAAGLSLSLSQNIAAPNQVALFLFDATFGQTTSIVETPATTLSAGTFALYAPSGALVSLTASDLNGVNRFIKDQSTANTGTYVLAISNDGGSGTAALTLFNLPAVDIGGTLTVGGPAATPDLMIPGEIPTYTFAGIAGQVIDLVTQIGGLTGITGFNGVVSITEPDGQTQLYFIPAWNGNTNQSGPLTLPVTGTYTVQFNPAGPATGTMSIQVETPITGTLTAGGPAVVSDLTAQPGDTVILTFAGTAGQPIDLLTQEGALAGGNGHSSVAITEPDGQTQLFSNPDFAGASIQSGPLALPVTGTYTVQYSPVGPAAGTMSIQLETPITGTLTAGGPAVVSDLTAQPGDAVILTFAGAAGQVIDLVTQIGGLSGITGFNGPISITEPDGQTQLYFIPAWIRNSNQSGPLTLPVAGTYTVQYDPAGPATGSMSIQVETPIIGTITAGGPAIVSDLTAQPGDAVILTFAGTAGQVIDLVTQIGGLSGITGFNGPVSITEPDGQTQLFFIPAWVGRSLESGALILPATGTYTVQFDPAGPATGTMSFQLDTPISSMLTLGGPSVTVSDAANPGAFVNMSFAGTVGQAVRLVTQADSSFIGTNVVTIIEPDGQTQLYSAAFNSNNLSGVLTLPETGTYVATFAPSSAGNGNVTMSLNQPIATTITIGGPPVATTVTSPGDVVDLAFAGTANQPVVLVTQPASSLLQQSAAITITDPDGQSQLYSAAISSLNLSSVLYLPTTGNYVAQFTPFGPGTGDLTMELDVPITGTLVAGGPTVTSNITEPGDAVILSFYGVAQQSVQLLTQTSSPLSGSINSVTIIEPDNQTQLYSTGFVSNILSGVLTLPTTGTYTVYFTQTQPNTGPASITLYDAGTNSNGSTDFTATIASPGSSAQLAFNGSSNSRVSLLTVADTNLRQGCFTISITAPGGTTQVYSSTQSSPTDFSGALTLPSNGLYTMLLTPCGSATGTASLTLYSVPPDATGSAMIGGAAASPTTTAPGQNVQVTFPTSAAGQTANVAITADANFSSACYNVTVTDPSGNMVNTGQGCGTSYSTGALTLNRAGTYNIAISSVSTATGNVTVGVTAQ
jgi:YD repeat-containing protein